MTIETPSNRRSFLKLAASTTMAGLVPANSLFAQKKEELYKVSLAEWSLHRTIFGRPGGGEKLDHLDFAKTAKSLGMDAIEYSNQMFFDKASDAKYIAEMKKRQDGEGVAGLLIMVDREGNLGDPDEAKRKKNVENHYKWLDAAAELGCKSLRVNAASDAKLSVDEQKKLAAAGLHALCVEADKRNLFVVVENHGGLSSNGKWLSAVMKEVNHPRVGILPDFGNFYMNRSTGEMYNPYLGIREFLPWVKVGMSAKSFDWDTTEARYYTEDRRPGIEMILDYERIIKDVVDSGYRGYIGIEYEGHKHGEIEGIKRTKQALDELKQKFS